MKYQSELIEEIVDTRGHKESSLHYESECVETWIEEAKGAYPKLCDYESEWLNYISVLEDTGGSEDPEPPIGEFPYVVLSDVTEATIDNVVPYAYKSAILKGQTTVNLINATFPLTTKTPTDLNGNFEYGKTYTIFFDIESIGTGDNIVGFVNNGGTGGWASRGTIEKNGKFSLTLTINTETNNGYTFRIRSNNTVLNSLMILEGDYTNVDIPYFEGIKSVQMPVLTTSNEDGTKTNILTVNEPIELRGIGDVKDELDLLTGELVQRTGKFMVDGTEDFGWYGNKGETLFEINIYKSSIVGKLNNEVDDTRPSLCSTLEYCGTTMYGKPGTGFAITRGSDTAFLQIVMQKEKLSDTTLDGIKRYFSENPLYFVVPLLDKTIKTVELNIQDQDGKTLSVIKPIEGKMFLSTSSDTIKPLFSGEIPVEAITQNLASFIDLD